MHSDSSVAFWFRASVTIGCQMDFEEFPMDEQSCGFYLSSNNYPVPLMVYKSGKAGFKSDSNRLQEFEVQVKPLAEEDKVILYPDFNVTYTQVGFILELERHSRTHVIKYMMPCCSLVVISWVSFLIPPTAIPGRIVLLVTLYLVIATLFSTIQSITPPSKSLTRMAVYTLTCLFFEFCAIIEFAFLIAVCRQKDIANSKQEPKQPSRPPTAAWQKTENDQKGHGEKKLQAFCYKVDLWSFVVFSVSFLLFNAIYISI